MINTRKISFKIVGNDKKTRKEIFKYILSVSERLAFAGNEVIRLHVTNQYEIDKIKNGRNITKGEAIRIVENDLATSIQNSGYQMLSSYKDISSNIRTAFNQNIFKTIKNNFKDIVNGKVSIPSFRKSKMKIPLNGVQIQKDDNGYYIIFPISRELKEEFGEIKLYFYFGRDRSNNRIIVDRIFDGTYKLCDSSISINDTDIDYLMVFDHPQLNENTLDENKAMGVDLGMNRLVSFYISDEKHQPKQIEVGERIHHERIRYAKQRATISQQLKYSKGGHGIRRKTQALNELRSKESNWATNLNHIVSKNLIDIAIKYKVGTIKLEDLTGISKDTNVYYLKTWKFYQLQEFIKYKAEQVGIKVIWVNPKNTSITCPYCGNVSKDNRNDKDKTIFKCVNEECEQYGVRKDADIVGAINITNTSGEDFKLKSKKGKIELSKRKKETQEQERNEFEIIK